MLRLNHVDSDESKMSSAAGWEEHLEGRDRWALGYCSGRASAVRGSKLGMHGWTMAELARGSRS
jgi:hypothetical protein